MFTNYIYIIENSFSTIHNNYVTMHKNYMVTNSYVDMKNLVHASLLHSLSCYWKDLTFETCKNILKDFAHGLKSTEKNDKKIAFHIENENNHKQTCMVYNRTIETDKLLQEVYLCTLLHSGYTQELHVVETMEEAKNIITTIYENNCNSQNCNSIDLTGVQQKTHFYYEFPNKNDETLSLSIDKHNIVTF